MGKNLMIICTTNELHNRLLENDFSKRTINGRNYYQHISAPMEFTVTSYYISGRDVDIEWLKREVGEVA